MIKLDLRRPSIIVTGAWNSVIFQAGWILRYLFQVEEGKIEKVGQIIIAEDPPKIVTFTQNIGITALQHRLEFYLNTDALEARTLLETVVMRTLETLPHTPIGALGLNYHFSTDDPGEAVDDKLKARDNIEQLFKVKAHGVFSEIEYADGLQLNFRRDVSARGAEFDFNYHHNYVSVEKFRSMLNGNYGKLLDQSKTCLHQLYDLDQFDVITSPLENQEPLHDKNQANERGSVVAR